MKYRFLLYFLRALMLFKRFFWLFGHGFGWVFGGVFGRMGRVLVFTNYKINYLLKRVGITGQGGWLLKRDNLQVFILFIFIILVLPQTKIFSKEDPNLFGRKTIAYQLFAADYEEYSLEEVSMNENMAVTTVPSWREGAISNDYGTGLAGDMLVRDQDLGSVVAGGMAITKPTLITGSTIGSTRDQVVDYEVQSGDSLSSIAYNFDVSVATVMWENNLTLRSLLKLGQILKIPPTTGVMHTIKKGDNVQKIAILYGAKTPDIITFNKLDEDGASIKIGERIMVPNGVMPQARAIATVPRSTGTISRRVVPGSSAGASASGFVWPSGVRTITQYYGWTHHGLDVAGPFHTPNYAAKAGKVEFAQCGWNRGYGCYVQIDHGNGMKTLYGHNDVLLVSPGDYVTAGQTIGLMGNTGNVRGRTGIHLHFEIIINGARVNPLGYVR